MTRKTKNKGKAEVGAVVMQEGLAHVCIVLSSLTIVKSKIQLAIPQKRFVVSNFRIIYTLFLVQILFELTIVRRTNLEYRYSLELHPIRV